MNRDTNALIEALQSWEDYDYNLSPGENFLELQLAMGMVDDSRKIVDKIMQESKKEL